MYSTPSPSFLLAQAIFEPNLLPYGYSNNPQILSFYIYLPMKMEQTECSETSAYNIQKPWNYPEENIQQLMFLWTLESSQRPLVVNICESDLSHISLAVTTHRFPHNNAIKKTQLTVC
jgi:hypothetical protein